MSFGFGVGDFIAVLDKAKLYRERFADAPDHFDSLSREIASLTSVLEYFVRIEDQLTEYEKDASATSITEIKKLLGQMDMIYNDNLSLENIGGTSKLLQMDPRVVWRRLRMKPEDAQKLRQRINLNVSILNAIKGCRDSEAIRDSKQMLVLMRDDSKVLYQQRILQWLSCVDYESQQQYFFSCRQKGTGQWFLDSTEFKTWTHGIGQTLLCPGIPGAGKTIMTSIVVNELTGLCSSKIDNIAIAYVYCNFKDQGSQSAYNIISSIAQQLARSSSPFSEDLTDLYERHIRSGVPRTPQETVTLLQYLSLSFQRVFIIIDALDECEEQSRHELLSEIFELQNTCSQNNCSVNVLFTTRDIPDVLSYGHLKAATQLRIQADEGDVRKYVTSKISRMRTVVQSNTDLQEEIKSAVSRQTKGMFLQARLLVELLSLKRTPNDIRTALANVPTGNDMYARFYEDAWQRVKQQSSKDDADLATQVIGWVVCAKSPLVLSEVQHALAVNKTRDLIDGGGIYSAEDIISVCQGLVTVDVGSLTIRLAHQTIQEYFEVRRHELFPRTDSDITTTCTLCITMNRSQKSAASIPWHHDDRPTPFFEYAAKYWGDHAREAHDFSPAVPELMKYFQDHASGLSECINSMDSFVRDRSALLNRSRLVAWFGILEMFKRRVLSIEEVAPAGKFQYHNVLWWAAAGDRQYLVDYFLSHSALNFKTGLTHLEVDYDGNLQADEGSLLFWPAFSIAIGQGSNQTVQVFIDFCEQQGVELDVGLEQGQLSSLLCAAMTTRDLSKIKLLLDRLEVVRTMSTDDYKSISLGATSQKNDLREGTSGEAAENGLEVAIQEFLSVGADIVSLISAGNTHLYGIISLLCGSHESQREYQQQAWSGELHKVLSRLLADNEDIIERTGGFTNYAPSLRRESSSQTARDTVARVSLTLLRYGTTLEARDEGQVLSTTCVMRRMLDILLHNHDTGCSLADAMESLLLFAKLDLKSTAEPQRTPVWHAINHLQSHKGLKEAIELFLSDPRVRSSSNSCQMVIPMAIQNDEVDLLRYLVSRDDVDINGIDETGMTPLMYTLKHAKVPAFNALQSLGASSDNLERLLKSSLTDSHASRPVVEVLPTGRRRFLMASEWCYFLVQDQKH